MPDRELPLSTRASNLCGSIIDSSVSLLGKQAHDTISFAMGAPSDDLMPVELLDQLAAISSPSKYSYGNTEGERMLVDEIQNLCPPKEKTSPERITVTTGGMQGLDLAFKLFIDPGDLVITEGPTYTNAYATALSYGADIHEAPVDEEGLIVESLPAFVDRLGRTPKAIYTIPNFQNPSGVTLSRSRREMLLELSGRWSAVIIDDDAYGMLGFQGTAVPSFAELSPGNPLVFSVRTFSKILAPGLRIGWVDADPSLHRLLINAKQAMDTCTSVPTQRTVAEFLRKGHLRPHLERVRMVYRERKDAMVASLEAQFGTTVRPVDSKGGIFLWATFEDEAFDTSALFEPALEQGVAFIPGTAFSPAGNFRNAMRLCYATSDPARIDVGMLRLKTAVDLLDGCRP